MFFFLPTSDKKKNKPLHSCPVPPASQLCALEELLVNFSFWTIAPVLLDGPVDEFLAAVQ